MLTKTHSNPNGSLDCIYSPLIISITNGFYAQAKLLLETGACPNFIERDEKMAMNSNNNQFALIFSPLRSAIIYERREILSLLLKHGANVNELIVNSSSLENAKLSDYLNCLKLLFRHLIAANFKSMIELNDFIENVNIYRMMAISFLNSVFENDENVDRLFHEFLLMGTSINTTNFTFTQTLLLEYLTNLVTKFYKPKSLKELCRFKIRKYICITNNRNFELIVNKLDNLPNSLKMFILHEN